MRSLYRLLISGSWPTKESRIFEPVLMLSPLHTITPGHYSSKPNTSKRGIFYVPSRNIWVSISLSPSLARIIDLVCREADFWKREVMIHHRADLLGRHSK